MARTILFVIHGVGQRAPAGSTNPASDAAKTWWKEPVDTIVSLARKHAPRADIGLKPKDEGVQIVPLSYCDVLVDHLVGWKDAADGTKDVSAALRARYPALGEEYLAELSDITTDDSDFFWSKAVDVLLYRVFLDVRIRQHVRTQIVRALKEHASRGRVPAAAFVSHSLGTAVLHDTLAELLRDPVEFGGIANIDVLAYVSLANVSKVLTNLENPYESPVRPFGAGHTAGARMRRFINARHELDPIPYIGGFNPDWDPQTSNYSLVTMNRITDPNTHSFVEYLKHPGVWAPLFEAILDKPVTPEQLEQLTEQHDKAPLPPCAAALETLRDEVESLKDAVAALKPTTAWQSISAFTRAARVIEEARTACVKAGANAGGGR